MKLLIVCSKRFYDEIPKIKTELEKNNIEVFFPIGYDEPQKELEMWNLGIKEHQKFKASMYKQSEEIIKKVDAVLVLNFDKNTDGKIEKNYIGGAVFLEIYDAFRLNKKIYLYNDIPDSMLYDEINGFAPIVINGDLLKIVNDINK